MKNKDGEESTRGMWLYPMAKKARKYFDGRIPVSIESFSDLVRRGKLEEEGWHVAFNGQDIGYNDHVYFYTGDENAGIIGFATVIERYWRGEISLRINRERTLALLRSPPAVPATIVRQWFQPRFTVHDLRPYAKRLERLLPWTIGSPNWPPSNIKEACRSGGAGLGSRENNLKVERAAVDYAKEHFAGTGWSVVEEPPNNPGYDLRCVRHGEELLVEVKGVKGSEEGFVITPTERTTAKADRRFRLCVVTKALTKHPEMRMRTGSEMAKDFEFKPTSYWAAPS
jgi:hypothetical protein